MSKRILLAGVGAAVVLVALFLMLRKRPVVAHARATQLEPISAMALPKTAGGSAGNVARVAAPVAKAKPAAQPLGREEPVTLARLNRTREEDELIWNAEQKAVAECMRERGFTYTPTPFDDTDDLEVEALRAHPTDVEAAQEHGYGLAELIEANARREREPEQTPPDVQQMTPQRRQKFVEALLGPNVPPQARTAQNGWETVTTPQGAEVSWYKDSCYARARDRIHGKDYAQNELGTTRSELADEVEKRVDADPEYREALESWRACMRAQGQPQTTPGAAIEALSNAYNEHKIDLAEVRSREVSIASVEASCNQQTGLEARTASVRARHERSVLDGATELVASISQSKESAVANARGLLGSVAD